MPVDIPKCFLLRVDPPISLECNDGSCDGGDGFDGSPLPDGGGDMFSLFVSDVSDEGTLEMGFTEPLSTQTLSLFSMPGMRRLSSSPGDPQESIDKIFEVQLSSTKVADAPTLKVDWELLDIETQVARLQLNLDSLHVN